MRKRETSKGAKAPKHAKAGQPAKTPKAGQPAKTPKAAKARKVSRAEDSADKDQEPIVAPANISLLYESRDGKLCLFQDGEGHLTAVRTDRLA